MRILELTNYSAGICGVFSRVKEESTRLSRAGHTVRIFTSNLTKGSNEIAPSSEVLGNVKVTRFPAKKLGGESYMTWNFESEALKFNPEVIIVHAYRHLHTTKALRIKKKIGCRVFLVTHAPFVEKNITRSTIAKFSVSFYDKFIGSRTLKRFDKIIAITNWEIPYLTKLGVKKESIVYIPNGIPEEFFKVNKLAKEEGKILFFGRISPIKNLEVLITAFSKIEDQKIKLEIVGPAEERYSLQLKKLVAELQLTKRVIFSKPVYNLMEKIKKIDSAKIFVLPSKREAMPQALIEAMARGKLVIASDNPGSKEIIKNNRNGYIFRNGDEKDLAEKINISLKSNHSSVRKLALESVKEFNWKKVIRKIEKLL